MELDTMASSADSMSVAVFAPAMLLSVEVHRTGDGADEVHLHAGGQGYWIARMVQALGARPIPCAAVGGESGIALRAIVEADGLDARLTHMVHANSVVMDDRRDGGRSLLAETPIPSLGRHEIDELYSAIVGAAMSAGVCVLAGTQLAPMFDPDTFRRLVADLRRNDVTVVVDLCGEPLRSVLDSGVDIVKLSHEEFIADGWSERSSVAAIAEGIGRLHAAGATAVVVSRQDRSTVAGFEGRIVEVRPPALEVLDGRGGGDSMTAALAVASSRGLSFDDGLRMAAAAAALNVSRHGLGTGRRDAIEDIAKRVEITTVRQPSMNPADPGHPLAELSKAELYEQAKARGVRGRSSMSRSELVEALANDGATGRRGAPVREAR
ncbi:MAG: PfkB family carbohydrate kinase [Ilumatobacter sp.]|uniref:PfkB family carbohydrate kinase n=1 Tax=Ilumatobacter sp. TaxID=1967498 RepID=UPI0032980BF3